MEQVSVRCAFYARSATVDQTGEDPVALQLKNIEMYALGKGYGWFSCHIYSEVASGSTYEDRPRFSALLEAAKNGEFDVLVIEKPDRLSRNKDHIYAIFGMLEKYGVRLECVVEDWGFGQIAPRWFIKGIVDSVSDIERELIAQRSAYGRKRKTNE